MTNLRIAIAVVCLYGLPTLALAQSTTLPRITAAQAKDYIGKQAKVCGKVVDNEIRKNGLAGFGFPVSFDLDEPKPNPLFYFVTFGPLGGQDTVVSTYQDKSVCVTGKVTTEPSGGTPFILATKSSMIKIQGK